METTAVEVVIVTKGSVELDDGNDLDAEGWYCIKTKRYFCEGCKMDFEFIHAVKRIVVWPEKDDPNLLELAASTKEQGGEPKVLEYQPSFGNCISYYEAKS